MGCLLALASLFVACNKDEAAQQATLPKVETGPITEVTTTSFTSACNILDEGNATITACGLVYSTAAGPSLETAQSTNEVTNGKRNPINSIGGLERNQKYYVRAYATNSAGTAYGAVRELTLKTSVAGITLSANELNLYLGQDYTLAVTFSPTNPHNPALQYEIDKPEIATISETGVITPKARGTATITVTAIDGGHTATCAIRVRRAVEGISFAESEISLVEGATRQLSPTIIPEEDADAAQITYRSESPTIASVSETGLVTAHQEGVVGITATLPEGKSARCTIRVTPRHIKVESISLSPSSLALAVDQTAKLTATISPLTATDKTITYTSQDPNIASVSADGTVLAKNIGTTTITATSKSEGKKATCAVEVKAKVIQVQEIRFTSKPDYLFVGEPWIVEYVVSPSNASNKAVEIISDDPSIADRRDVNGKPTIWAKKAGRCNIIIKALDGSEAKATASLLVKAVAPAVMDIVIPGSHKMNVGEVFTFTAQIKPEGAEADVLWSSSDETVATIDNRTGVVRALAPGQTAITAIVPVQHRQILKRCILTVVGNSTQGSEAYQELASACQEAEKMLAGIESLLSEVKKSGQSDKEKKAILKEALELLEGNLPVVIQDLKADINAKRSSLVGDEFKTLDAREKALSKAYDRVRNQFEDYYYSL